MRGSTARPWPAPRAAINSGHLHASGFTASERNAPAPGLARSASWKNTVVTAIGSPPTWAFTASNASRIDAARASGAPIFASTSSNAAAKSSPAVVGGSSPLATFAACLASWPSAGRRASAWAPARVAMSSPASSSDLGVIASAATEPSGQVVHSSGVPSHSPGTNTGNTAPPPPASRKTLDSAGVVPIAAPGSAMSSSSASPL